MKKAYLIVSVLMLIGIATTSYGIPDEPQEVLPYCKEQYELFLNDYPDFPPSFIGFCVATLQTGEPKGYQSLCSSLSFRTALKDMDESIVEVPTRKECLQYFQVMD